MVFITENSYVNNISLIFDFQKLKKKQMELSQYCKKVARLLLIRNLLYMEKKILSL